ncbi:hypothetical protein PILCRDRAFT_825881 [Piloderma croceum F 1598]|uniref:Uncharacterized protein n=1 Tax=Piloderma croceum (strain F 1598) TaxID=765440 RepID=A0A0C3FAX6_PILCF|nr:hypothetical protein PILCRDRAFT_825881 [Piloderma croceum F 1598]
MFVTVLGLESVYPSRLPASASTALAANSYAPLKIKARDVSYPADDLSKHEFQSSGSSNFGLTKIDD